MMPRFGADGAPPAVPIGSLLLGALALVAGALYATLNAPVLVGPTRAPALVALVHTFTLAYVGLVFSGTLQQLPAVMFVTKLAWPHSGYFTTGALVFGTAAVITGFATGFATSWLIPGAILVSLSWLLLCTQLIVTALRRWPEDAASHALIISVVLLSLTVLFGYVLSGARSSGAVARAFGYPMNLHLSLGLFGAYLLGIVGSGQKLLAMFALSKGSRQWPIRAATALITLGVIAEAVAAFTQLKLGWVPVALIAAGSLFHVLEVVELYRKRLRRKLEAPIQRYVIGHIFLPLAGVAVLFGEPVVATVLFMVGFLGMTVSGMLVKITSFLVWTAVFAGAGTGGVAGGAPLLKDLMRDELEPVTTVTFLAGPLVLALAMLLGSTPLAYVAAALLLLGSLSQFLQVSNVVMTTVRAGNRLKRKAREEGKVQPQVIAGGLGKEAK